MRRRSGLVVASIFVLSACSSPPPARGPAPPAEPPAKTPPRAKEFQATPADRLGTLVAGLGLPVGTRAPDVRVHDLLGQEVALSSFMKGGPVLLAFYRGGWCPFCNFQIQELVAAADDYARRGVSIVAVSVDRVEEAAKTKELASVPFALLSDPDLVAHDAFRVVHQVDDAEHAKLSSYGIDIEHASGRKHHRFAVPSLFLIDREGIVRWAHADPDYKVRPRTPQILVAIDRTLGAPPPASR